MEDVFLVILAVPHVSVPRTVPLVRRGIISWKINASLVDRIVVYVSQGKDAQYAIISMENAIANQLFKDRLVKAF